MGVSETVVVQTNAQMNVLANVIKNKCISKIREDFYG